MINSMNAKFLFVMLSVGGPAAFGKSTTEAPSPAPIGYDKMSLTDQMRDLRMKLEVWNSPQAKHDEDSRLDILSLIGEITMRENLINLKASELRVLIGALVSLAKNDEDGQVGMLALELTNVLGAPKIHPIIKDLDINGDLEACIKRQNASKE